MVTRLPAGDPEHRAFTSLEQEAYISIVRTATVLTDAFEQLVREAGITLPQYNVLRILRGSEPAGLCRNEVRDRMLTRMPDMTRLLDRMEAAGLVARTRDPEDRRMVRTRITEAGTGLLTRLDQPVAEAHRHQLAHLSREELQMLIELLRKARRR